MRRRKQPPASRASCYHPAIHPSYAHRTPSYNWGDLIRLLPLYISFYKTRNKAKGLVIVFIIRQNPYSDCEQPSEVDSAQYSVLCILYFTLCALNPRSIGRSWNEGPGRPAHTSRRARAELQKLFRHIVLMLAGRDALCCSPAHTGLGPPRCDLGLARGLCPDAGRLSRPQHPPEPHPFRISPCPDSPPSRKPPLWEPPLFLGLAFLSFGVCGSWAHRQPRQVHSFRLVDL